MITTWRIIGCLAALGSALALGCGDAASSGNDSLGDSSLVHDASTEGDSKGPANDAVYDAPNPDHSDVAVGDVFDTGALPPVDATPGPDVVAPPPKGCVQGTFVAARGDLHTHTSCSDGDGSPADAFSAGKAAGMDFLFVTDHVETCDEYASCRTTAKGATTGTFVAECAFEVLASGVKERNHANVLFNSSKRFKSSNVDNFFDEVASCKPCDTCAPCVAQFNHPSSSAMPWTTLMRDGREAATENMALYEFNGGGVTWEDRIRKFQEALRHGWRVAPTFNSDEHYAGWQYNDMRSGFWVESLTAHFVKMAMRARRSFGTPDPTAFLRMKVNGCWMGSVLIGVTDATVEVEAGDGSEGLQEIAILGADSDQSLGTIPCNGKVKCTGSVHLNSVPPVVFAHAKFLNDIKHASNARGIVGSPVWFQ